MSDTGNPGGAPSKFSDPDGYMRHFEQRMASMRDKGQQMNRLLVDVSVRLESDDREVAVTVNVGGALAIESGPSAKHLSGQGLAAMSWSCISKRRRRPHSRPRR